jgi:hypothetical protein
MVPVEERSEQPSAGEKLQPSPQRLLEHRKEPRVDLCVDGPTLREAGGTAAPVRLLDLSRHGFRTEWPYRLERGRRIWLKIPGLEAMPATVAWEANYTVGCKFDAPLHAAVLARIVSLHKPQR